MRSNVDLEIHRYHFARQHILLGDKSGSTRSNRGAATWYLTEIKKPYDCTRI